MIIKPLNNYVGMYGCSQTCVNIANRLKGLVLRKYQGMFELVLLFGSLVYGRYTPLSDIDIGVEFTNDEAFNALPSFISDVALELNLPEDRIDVVPLNADDLPIGLMYDAVVRGLPIYVRDWGKYVYEKVKVFSEYADFQVFLRTKGIKDLYLKSLRRILYEQDKRLSSPH